MTSKEICATITEHFNFEKIIPEEVIELKSPEAVIAEANRDRVVIITEAKQDRVDYHERIIGKLYSKKFRGYLIAAAERKEPVTLKRPQQVKIDNAVLWGLKDYVRRTLTVQEVIDFGAELTHGLKVMKTFDGNNALDYMWRGLVSTCHRDIGAAWALAKVGIKIVFGGMTKGNQSAQDRVYALSLDDLEKLINRESEAATRHFKSAQSGSDARSAKLQKENDRLKGLLHTATDIIERLKKRR